MKPLISMSVAADAVEQALVAESTYERTWLPPEPWWPALLANRERVAADIARRLARGHRWPRSQIVNVRKPGHGVRPVAVMAPEVRIVYRAIVSGLIPEEHRVERTAERYAEFVVQPVKNAFPTAGPHVISTATYSHVLVTDIAAFYQYIDHNVLMEELDLADADLLLTDALVEFLAEIQGRTFGLPQRSQVSDWLSEPVAERLERAVARADLDVWRYSDDFRVGCRGFTSALHAIEVLASAAQEQGLILNEQKTSTPSFVTYLIHNSNVEILDASAEIDPDDVEAAITTDYLPGDDDEAIDDAVATISRLVDSPLEGDEDRIVLPTLDAEQHRAVRRALNTLTKHQHVAGAPKLLSILAYQPAMTHLVIRYAGSIADAEPGVVETIDQSVARLSLNEWQCAWLAYAWRACNAEIGRDSSRARWLVQQFAARPRSLVAAEAAVTLAANGIGMFSILDERIRNGPDDFAAWYLKAVALLAERGAVSPTQVGAIKKSSVLATAILEDG